MTRTQALERARRVFLTSGMTSTEVDRQVGEVDRLLRDGPNGAVEATTAAGTPWSVPDGDEPLDYLIAHVLENVPKHAYRSEQAFALRFAGLPHRRRAQNLLGHPVAPGGRDSLEERMHMTEPGERIPAPRTSDEALAMQRTPRRTDDELSRRLGRTG